MQLAPIVLFVYNRKWHTKKTVNALKKNLLANKSELFIYSDGPKKIENFEEVQKVRQYIKTIKGFKKIKIIEKKKNLGLANSIILGVTEIINKYGKAIILEDDIVTSPLFLKFMNLALKHFKNKDRVWHISGWSYPINLKNNDDVYFSRVMHCWGWATWSNKWKHFEKNTDKLINKFSKNDISKLNLDGYNNTFWKQVLLNKKNKINTWAIFWYTTIFKKNGLCLHPCRSFTKNVGFDGSGSHTFDLNYKDNIFLNLKKKINFNIKIKENKKDILDIKNYLYASQKNIFLRLITKIFFR